MEEYWPRGMLEIVRRYTFKMYPNQVQAEQLHGQRRMMAELWNAALQMKEDYYRRERKTLSRFEIDKQIKDLRKELPEWKNINSSTPSQVVAKLELAFSAFFRRLKNGEGEAGYPRYRSVARGMNIPFRNNFVGWKFFSTGQSWRMTILGIDGQIKCRGQFPQQPLQYCGCVVMWRDENWWLSVAVKVAPRITGGNQKLTINFDLIDKFVDISADGSPMEGLLPPPQTDLKKELQSARDLRYKKFSYRWKKETRRIARLDGRLKRRRNNFLHNWSTDLVKRACDVTVIAPDKIKDITESPRGNEKEWGGAVKTVSILNENILNQAPALAISMLSYKCEEANIRCDRIIDESPKVAIGRDLVKSRKVERRLKRKIKELENV